MYTTISHNYRHISEITHKLKVEGNRDWEGVGDWEGEIKGRF